MQNESVITPPIWKTISIGAFGDAETVRQLLTSTGVGFDAWANDILERMPFEATVSTLNLVQVLTKELGFSERPTTAEVHAKSRALGLSLCPPEVGPQLWLQYPDLLLRGQWIVVGMETVLDRHDHRLAFHLGHNIFGRRLIARTAHPKTMWDKNQRWVFIGNNKAA